MNAALLRRARQLGLVDDGAGDDWERLVADARRRIRDWLVEPQLRFFEDRSKFSAAVCGRQCGKSATLARKLIDGALDGPDRRYFYVNATADEARRVMWDDPLDGLPAVARELGLPCSSHDTRMELTFPNGSKVRCLGLDNEGYAKVRGSRLHGLVVDEAQKATGLAHALKADIPAALARYRGWVSLTGTPDRFCNSVFHDACAGRLPGFSVHRWTARDTAGVVPEVWEELSRVYSAYAPDDPVALRERDGLWVADDSSFVHPITDSMLWDGVIPPLISAVDGTMVPRRRDLHVYGGLDFGWAPDPMAIVVGSVSSEEGVLREVHSERMPLHTQNDGLAARLRALTDLHGVRAFYADNADPKTIDDLVQRYGLPVLPCKKQTSEGGKEFWTSDVNGALRSGTCKVLRGSALHGEMRELIYDPKAWERGEARPKPGMDDHCVDAWRYLFTAVHPNYVRKPDAPVDPRTAVLEDYRRKAEAHERRLDREARRRRS